MPTAEHVERQVAIAVMAFGFLVEKFDLFLEIAAPSLAGRTLSVSGQKYGNIAGLVLIVFGTVMIALAAGRFVTTAKAIDSREEVSNTGTRIDLALAVLLVLLGLSLFVYLTHAFVASV
jgi:putative membrane protein